jgi:dephospho-CoA kinase
MGKSTAAGILRTLGMEVIDTDQIARDIVRPRQPALAEIQKYFGAEIVDVKGELRRDQLAAQVFSDADKRATLESILHPRIREVWQREIAQWRSENKTTAAVIIPLLFETQAEGSFDSTICIACSRSTQMMRLRERGWSDEQIRQRIAAQWPLEKKITLSDYVVWTDTTLAMHAAQIESIVSKQTRAHEQAV